MEPDKLSMWWQFQDCECSAAGVRALARLADLPNGIGMFAQETVVAHRITRLRALAFGLALSLAIPTLAQADAASQGWLARQFASYEAGATAVPAGAPSAIAQSLATWEWLRRPPKAMADAPPLHLQARFIADHPDWPGVTAMRRRAEAQAADPLTPDGNALAYLRALAPRSGAGKARLALLSSGQEALALAREAWVQGGFDQTVEDALWARYAGQLTRTDHARRADRLLWGGQTTAATRMLNRMDDEGRALTLARLALRSGAPDAEARAASVPASVRTHPGLVHDRATFLERRNQLSAAEALLASGGTTPGANEDVERWLERRLALGRAAMRRGDHNTAYRLLANHRAVADWGAAAGLPLSVRVDLSDTEWLAGWIALRKLDRPADAATHFQNFLKAVTTPISQTRGAYWLGRAEDSRGRKAEAQAAYRLAAQHPDYFYGQLAAEALGELPALFPTPPAQPTAEDRARFQASSVRQAMEMLNAMGSRERESLFVRALADSVTSPGEARLAGELGQKLNRPDIGVWTWKAVRPGGDTNLVDLAFPRLPPSASIPAQQWLIGHAIARQESSFDRTAMSSAGARGLMQLMPATARDVAAKTGQVYDVNRLFSDPAYNISLGSYYIGLRRDNFSNAMMAIAAYNAGAGNVRKWIALNGDPRTMDTAGRVDWIEMIPFQETRNYVQRVTENAVVYSLLEPQRPGANPRASAWLSAG